jgi:hypothetical protein
MGVSVARTVGRWARDDWSVVLYVARNQDDSSNEGWLYSILRPFNIRSRTSKDRSSVALTYNGKCDLRRYGHAGEY